MTTFSPREVQARVRAGESADDVAASTGWDLSKVLRYAEPLLAERSFMAQQATGVEVRRSGGGATLAEAASAVLGPAEADAVVWDAFRREDDGRWIVTAHLEDGTVACWTYDHHGRNLHALDDHARALMGASPQAVRDTEVDIAAALDLAGDLPVVRDEAPARPHLVAVPSAETSADDEPEAAKEPPMSPAADSSADRGAAAYEQETLVLPRETPVKSERKPKSRKGRTSVPSWDEILFGAGRSDD